MMIAVGLGTVVGSVAGFFGGKTDQVLMRVVDLFLALPVVAAAAADSLPVSRCRS